MTLRDGLGPLRSRTGLAFRALIASVIAVAWMVYGAVSPAVARDYVVTSFDGTPIIAHFFPAPGLNAGQREPTVLEGPGWSGAGVTDTTEASTFEQIGMAALLKAHYNVMTWDPRGFGGSGDVAHVDGPDYEARDVSALLDLIAKQPEARLDGPRDPRVGMVGGSYGGGIQWITAATDPRVDAMVPNSSWHSLESSLFPDGDFKMGILTLLYSLGATQGTAGGLDSPAGPQTGSMDPHVTSFYRDGMTTGTISAADADWFRSRGPWNRLSHVRIPTFITQGTPDILFPISEAIRNYEALRANGVPVKMLWHCGGHGKCLDNPGTDGDNALRVERETLAWLARYLRGDRSVDTGPGFEWVSQDGMWHAAPSYPLPPAKHPLTAVGSGTLPLHPSPGTGTLMFAASSPEGVDVDVPSVTEPRVEIVGEPKLRIIYTGTATPDSTFAYAQIVDLTSGHVVGNQATPIPLTLDGRTHTIERSLNAIAYSATPSSRLQVQIIPATALYREQTSTGLATLQHVDIALPAVSVPPVSMPPRAIPRRAAKMRLEVSPLGRLRAGRRELRFRVRLHGGAIHRLRISLSAGHRVLGQATATSTRAPRSGRVVTLRLRHPLRRGGYTLIARAVAVSGARAMARLHLRVR